ncbi:hypothetical protein [Sphingomonas sp.]|jgi:hypothetical protein|uniref:hypothetical protein n=1 Tax=Sphingomonas sp. TaxID=28214 RepID=UPI002EDAF4BA
MVAFRKFPSVRFPRIPAMVAPLGALVVGGVVSAGFALMPGAMLEDWVWRSGIPALIAAAAPPLGTTARAVLALGGGMLSASVTWSVLYLLFGSDGLLAPKTRANAVPVVRRADAHPDAPPRRPMTAADLGTPLMDIPAAPPAPRPPAPPPPIERAVPVDLDQPLSAFDPAAIPDVPLPAPVRLAPLARTALAPGERIDAYVLTPRPPVSPPPVIRRACAPAPPSQSASRRVAPSGGAPSIDALLQRLEARLGGVPAR